MSTASLKALSEICTLVYGSSLPAQKRDGGKYNVFGSNGSVGQHSEALTSGSTIVIGRKGSIGEVHFSEDACWPIDTTYYIDESSTKSDLKWLYYLLKYLNLREMNKSAAVPGLNRDDVYDLAVHEPDTTEQRAIAQRLERADRLRRLRQHALTISDRYLQNVFLEMFGDPEANPKGWEREELGELIQRFEGGINFPPVADSAPSSKYRVLKISAVTWGSFDPSESKPIAVETQIKPEIVVRKGDLLFSRANTTELVGSVSMVTEEPPHVVLPDKIWRVVFKAVSRLDPHYTMSYLRSPYARRQIGDLATGSSGSMKNISMGKANSLIFTVPPLELQQQYALVVQKHERLRRMQVEALRQAEQLFETLLEEAFGQKIG